MKRTKPSKASTTATATDPHGISIGDHGIVGDLSTVALVGINGTIDFMCMPRFDSPTVFSALLHEEGGYFQLCPINDDVRSKQIYLHDTNILLTRFLSPEGVAELMDFMPICDGRSPTRLVRRLKVMTGKLTFRLDCNVQLDYGKQTTHAKSNGDSTVWTNRSKKHRARLNCPLPIEVEDSHAISEFTLKKDDVVDFIFEQADEDEDPDFDVDSSLLETEAFWRRWSSKSQYRGRWRELVNRSALVLKLLTSKEYGSMVAAPTFGLPEILGGERNWDYRYTWIRDASFSIYALIRLGFVEEAGDFMRWIEERTKHCHFDGSLKTMYRVDGTTSLEETELEAFSGYQKSRPVRVGNGACDQLQLDIYGELMDAAYLANKYGEPVSYDAWLKMIDVIGYVEKNWRRKDYGIWEIRGKPREFLHSRLMCWVAVDRALRLAAKRSLPAPFEHWTKLRNEIYTSIFEEFWNEKDECFIQAKGLNEMDASMLLMPLMKCIGPKDPRWLSTLKKIEEVLVEDTMVHRYRDDIDNLPGQEHSFTTCSFWYIECLALAGRTTEALLLFDKMLSYSNHLGLYSEELGPAGDHLGNFPQALTHLALISAAFALDRALDHTTRGAAES